MSIYSQNQDFSTISRGSQPITQFNRDDPFKIFDFLFPGSHSAKLVRVYDAYAKNFPFKDILRRLNLAGGAPVLNIIGGKGSQNRSKLYAGIVRGCFNTDAVIIDSAVSSGVEKHALRMGVKLIGVAPENEIQYPKVNSTFNDPSEISQGHTHLFLINNPENDLQWTQECLFKATLALRIAEGDYNYSGVYQRVVNVLVGDTPNYIDDIRLAVKFQQPILIAPGSKLCNSIIQAFSTGMQSLAALSQELADLMINNMQYFFMLLESNSDEVAQYVHFFLTVTPFKQAVPLVYQAKQSDKYIPNDTDFSPKGYIDQRRQFDDENNNDFDLRKQQKQEEQEELEQQQLKEQLIQMQKQQKQQQQKQHESSQSSMKQPSRQSSARLVQGKDENQGQYDSSQMKQPQGQSQIQQQQQQQSLQQMSQEKINSSDNPGFSQNNLNKE